MPVSKKQNRENLGKEIIQKSSLQILLIITQCFDSSSSKELNYVVR